jgi:hypothetical protein
VIHAEEFIGSGFGFPSFSSQTLQAEEDSDEPKDDPGDIECP